MSAIPDTESETIGAQLERLRLQRRETQLALMVRLLRDRARAGDACETERSGLHRALADFAAELTQIRQRLNETPPPRPPASPRPATADMR